LSINSFPNIPFTNTHFTTSPHINITQTTNDTLNNITHQIYKHPKGIIGLVNLAINTILDASQMALSTNQHFKQMNKRSNHSNLSSSRYETTHALSDTTAHLHKS